MFDLIHNIFNAAEINFVYSLVGGFWENAFCKENGNKCGLRNEVVYLRLGNAVIFEVGSFEPHFDFDEIIQRRLTEMEDWESNRNIVYWD